MKNLATFEHNLGVTFKNKEILEEALTHRSYLNESKTPLDSNERLEFLGDAILSFIVSSYLFKEFKDIAEGDLTNLRSAVVRTTTLATVAKKLSMGEYLRLSHGEEDGGGRDNQSLLADSFEAIVGAIYLDLGIEVAREFIHKHLITLLPEIIEKRSYKDYKSQFQEKVQEQKRISPVYQVLKEEGPDHNKVFTMGVYVENILLGTGIGRSKQDAEQSAAAQALENWEQKR